jgi:gliding motility-associated-like protein
MRIAKLFFVFLVFLILYQKTYSNQIVVTSNADSGPGTFRDALVRANNNGTAAIDTITFSLPDLSEPGRTITLFNALPKLTSRLVIDGSTQPGAFFGISGAKIKIQFNTNISESLFVLVNATDVRFYGLYIRPANSNYTAGTAFEIWLSQDIVIGGPGRGNVINAVGSGVLTMGSFSSNLVIQSNMWGVSPSGDHGGIGSINDQSLLLSQSQNVTIGGMKKEEGNMFSDLNHSIILTYGRPTSVPGGKIIVANNSFNINSAGDRSINTFNSAPRSLYILGHEPSFPSDSIIISSNHFGGIQSIGLTCQDVKTRTYIQKNIFGVTKNDNKRIVDDNFRPIEISGSDGVWLGGSDAEKNIIGHARSGIRVMDCKGVTISQNVMFCNDGIYRDYNDAGKFPAEPFVNIETVQSNHISGSSKPLSLIELFESDSCGRCVGMNYKTSFSADNNGKWNYTGALPTHFVLTATDSYGGTSEFSKPEIRNSNALIQHPTCNKKDGSIKHLMTINCTYWKWTDELGNIVGTDSILLNVGPGKYKMEASYPNSKCVATSSTYVLGYSNAPMIDQSAIKIIAPSCGQFNGKANYSAPLAPGIICWWQNQNGLIVAYNSLQAANLSPGTYTMVLATAVDTTCRTSSQPIHLVNSSPSSVFDLTMVKITDDQCGLNKGSIDGIQINGLITPINYKWEDRNGQQVGNNVTLKDIGSGEYRLTVTDTGTCSVQSNWFSVSNNNTISGPVYDPQTILKNSSAQLNLKGPASGEYLLYRDMAASVLLQKNTTGDFLTGPLTRDTSFFVKRISGTCVSAVTPVKVSIVDKNDIYVPTAFTPNYDGRNDYLKAIAVGPLKLNKFAVYNRFGQIVFSTDDINTGWDGLHNGRVMNAGTFIWTVNATDLLTGSTIVKKGTVVLIR